MYNLSFRDCENEKLTLVGVIVENSGTFFKMLPIHIGVLRIWDDDAGSRNKLDRVSYYFYLPDLGQALQLFQMY